MIYKFIFLIKTFNYKLYHYQIHIMNKLKEIINLYKHMKNLKINLYGLIQ